MRGSPRSRTIKWAAHYAAILAYVAAALFPLYWLVWLIGTLPPWSTDWLLRRLPDLQIRAEQAVRPPGIVLRGLSALPLRSGL